MPAAIRRTGKSGPEFTSAPYAAKDPSCKPPPARDGSHTFRTLGNGLFRYLYFGIAAPRRGIDGVDNVGDVRLEDTPSPFAQNDNRNVVRQGSADTGDCGLWSPARQSLSASATLRSPPFSSSSHPRAGSVTAGRIDRVTGRCARHTVVKQNEHYGCGRVGVGFGAVGREFQNGPYLFAHYLFLSTFIVALPRFGGGITQDLLSMRCPRAPERPRVFMQIDVGALPDVERSSDPMDDFFWPCPKRSKRISAAKSFAATIRGPL